MRDSQSQSIHNHNRITRSHSYAGFTVAVKLHNVFICGIHNRNRITQDFQMRDSQSKSNYKGSFRSVIKKRRQGLHLQRLGSRYDYNAINE